MRTRTHAPVKGAPMPAFLAARGGSPQRRSIGPTEPAAAPLIGREGRRWSSPPLDPAPRVVGEPRFSRDYSDIPVSAPRFGADRDFLQPAASTGPTPVSRPRPRGGVWPGGPAPASTDLAVSRPGDPLEQEADQVAARVMNAPGAAMVARRPETPVLSRQAAPAADAKQEKVAPAPGGGAAALAQGEKWIGTPYESGGDSKKGIDCSHFVHRAYAEAGLDYAYLNTGSFPASPNFSPVDAPLTGDVVLYAGHMGLHNPAPPESGKTLLCAFRPGASLGYGKPEWFGAVKGYYRYQATSQPQGKLQKKSIDGNGSSSGPVPSIVDEVLHSPGQALDTPTRAFMEPRFGHDFSQVRVHADAKAADSARAVNALAYTVGRNVVFGAGQYAPQTDGGRQLMAHELAHAIQQGQATSLHPGESRAVAGARDTAPALQRQHDASANSSKDPAALSNEQLVAEYQRVLAASDPAMEGYFLALESELGKRIQETLRQSPNPPAGPTAASGTPVAQAGMNPITLALALRLLLTPAGGAVPATGAAVSVAAPAAAGEVAAGAAAETLGAGAAETLAAPVAETTALTAEATAPVIAEEGALALLGDVALAAFEVAGPLAILLWPSPIAPEPPIPQAPRRPDEEDKRSACQRLDPQAIPIWWPSPLWQFAAGIDDPGAESPEYDLPQTPLLMKAGSAYYDPTRPEIGRYITRITNPPFRLTVPPGWPVHHKWPLYLGGDVAVPQEGEYDAEGRTLAPPNLVVLDPAVHAAWHRMLEDQPAGPRFGQGPSPRTPDGTCFCVMNLV